MRAITLGMAAILAGWAAPAAAQQVKDMKIHQGNCSAESQVAGKPFACDMLITAVTEPGSLMLIFMHKADEAAVMLGVGGKVEKDGSLTIEHVQLKPGERTPFDGRCAIKRKGRYIRAVRCTATERGGERSVTLDMPGVVEIRP